MVKRLLIIGGDDPEHFFLSVEEGTLIIGTNPWSAEVVFRDLHVRGVYCEVEVDEDLVVVDNTGTKTGTPGGGAPPRQELHPGESLHIGHTSVGLVAAADESPGMPAPAAGEDFPEFAEGAPTVEAGWSLEAIAPLAQDSPAAPPAAAAPPQVGQRKKLVVVDGADQGRFYNLPESGTTTIGKSRRHADIELHDLYVARVHCELQIDGDRIVVRHLEGTNGTLINGQRINGPQDLRLGDVLRVGNSHLRLDVVLAGDHAGPETGDDGQAAEEAAVEFVGEVEVLDAEPAAPSTRVDELLKLEGQVLGHYQIGPLLGRGKRGLVFQSHDVKNNHVVALKVLSPDFPQSDAEMQTFVKALKVLPQLKHPHLLSLYGAGKTGPYCWLAREYVEGESLTGLIERLQAEGKLGWKRACRVAVHLGRVLDFLHVHKVNHGNITPGNVLVCTESKMTKLADLMLDKALEGSKLYLAVRESKMLAELPFQAPEQVDGKAAADHRVDLYALGTVLYTLIAGQPPFTGASQKEVVKQIREAKVVKPSKFQPEIPPLFQGAILRLMARRPEDRYQTAAEMVADVEAIAKSHDIKLSTV